ncbi:heparan sulfate 2-O-sulfotransferase pipe-like isoform X2 [Penaeus indicus]|uniref:heparan sulfate 2-O-sulfotransferase pipe-like isoform X2 n=1 Tax=Penaeus indicus TaxID=29960 RepID=UPI00300D95F4
MAPRRYTTVTLLFLMFAVLCLYLNFQLTNNKMELPPPVREFLQGQNLMQGNTLQDFVPTQRTEAESLQALLEDVNRDADEEQIDQDLKDLNFEEMPPLPLVEDLPEADAGGVSLEPTARNVTARDARLLIVSAVPLFRARVTSSLVKTLGERNGFRVVMPLLPMQPKMGLYQRDALTKYITSAAEQEPVAFVRDMYFFDVTRMGFARPVWTAIVQDPVERLVSIFLHAKEQAKHQDAGHKDRDISGLSLEQCVISRNSLCWYSKGEQRTLQLSFFCGQHTFCEVVGSRSGLQMAKYQVEHQFSVVGVLEELTLSYAVLQEYVPRYWGNASIFMIRTELGSEDLETANYLNTIPEKVRQYLRALLKEEIDFYLFVRQRLHLQAASLGLAKQLY